MSPDSLELYRDALLGDIGPFSRSPLLTVIWMGVLRIWPGPFGLLLLQAVVFWSGLTLIIVSLQLNAVRSCALVLGIGFFPAVFALLGTLWVDVWLAASLTLFVGIVASGVLRRSRTLLAFSILPLACGLSARVNALPAILPLTAWLVTVWFSLGIGPRRISRSKTLVISGIVLAGLLAALTLFNRAAIGGAHLAYTRPLQFSLFHDLAGIAASTDDLRLPSRVHRTLPWVTLDTIKKAYDPADVNLLIYNDAWDSSAFLTEDSSEFNELVHVWTGAIRAHPLAYAKRRISVLGAAFQVNRQYNSFHQGIHPNNFGLTFVRRPLNTWVVEWLNYTQGVFFRGWVFLLVAMTVVVAGVRRRSWASVAVSASGLLYVAPYAVITTGADFRYILWLVVSSLIGATLFFCEPRAAKFAGFDLRPGPPEPHVGSLLQ
jgi:hypothetical protein